VARRGQGEQEGQQTHGQVRQKAAVGTNTNTHTGRTRRTWQSVKCKNKVLEGISQAELKEGQNGSGTWSGAQWLGFGLG